MPKYLLKKKDNWPKRLIGLTGPMCAGKSAVARLISQEGIPVLDVDCLAREVVKPGSEVLQRLVRTTQRDILKSDGSLDRARLLDLMLSGDEIKKNVEGIMHPEIYRLMDKRLQSLAEAGAGMVFVEVPLLFEAGWEDMFDFIITVSAPEELCMERLVRRNDIEPQKARDWFKWQMPPEEKSRRADYIIFNDLDLDSLKSQVMNLIGILKAKK